MKTKKINGLHMEKMLRNALANLCLHEEELNSLNVFPVADGDTGTNMRATLESGLNAAKATSAMGVYLKPLSEAMLFGAHGNSGVILSQIFRGFFTALSHCGSVTPVDLRNALICGYKLAYSSVVRPVEGTILTVAREGIEHIKYQVDRNTSIEDLLSLYIAEMRKSLAYTPEILPQLKEAGVIDSGALGYIIIFEGMLKYLYGDILEADMREGVKQKLELPSEDNSLFNENSLFDSGYCVEFVLQLMRGKQYSQRFNLSRFISDLEDFGSSIVAVQDEKRVKVHIHTFKPGKVLSLSQEFGELVVCKVENMQLQHNSLSKEKRPEKKRQDFAVISVADSVGMQQIFADLGSEYVISGGSKMNVSVQDFIDALKTVNADTSVILPNNSNLIRVANQAKELYTESNVVVLDTHTIPQGYSALAMDIEDEKDSGLRIKHMRIGMNGVITLSVATADKEYRGENLKCSAGMQIAVSDGNVLSCSTDPVSAFCDGLKAVSNMEEYESCIVFRGRCFPEESEAQLEKRISVSFPNLEVSIINGGSELYHLSAAIS